MIKWSKIHLKSTINPIGLIFNHWIEARMVFDHRITPRKPSEIQIKLENDDDCWIPIDYDISHRIVQISLA